VAVHLPEHGWYRMDPRGNRQGVDAQFTPPVERLAFAIEEPGEALFQAIYADPLPIVVTALQRVSTTEELASNLPDLTEENQTLALTAAAG
jgi:hypothetical protein